MHVRQRTPHPLLRAGARLVCALLRGYTLDIANAGDTRAVLGCKPPAHPRFAQGASSGRTLRERDLDAVRLSVDHKPNLTDEIERVQAAGGSVKNISGCWRVAGPRAVAAAAVLACSISTAVAAATALCAASSSASRARTCPRRRRVLHDQNRRWHE